MVATGCNVQRARKQRARSEASIACCPKDNSNNNAFISVDQELASREDLADESKGQQVGKSVWTRAATVDDKLASESAQHQAVGEPKTNNGQQQQVQEAAGKTTDSSGQQQLSAKERGGLLQALLGEKAGNWLGQRTVILDIRNGKRKKDSLAEGESKEQHNLEKILNKEEKPKEVIANKSIETPIRRSPIVLNKQLAGDRVPTFGSVPQRLTRLPYISYQGQAKNLNTIPARKQVEQLNRSTTRRASSTASLKTIDSPSSTSTSSSASRTSGQFRIASSASSVASSSTKNRLKNIGYSNISNLFPTKQNTPSSSSEQAKRRLSNQVTIDKDQQMNRRRNSFALPTAEQAATISNLRARSNQSISGLQQQSMYSTGRSRPVSGASVLGVSRHASASNLAQTSLPRRPLSSAARFPSTRSPNFNRNARTSSQARFDSYGQPPVDPDCPVHGDDTQRVGTLTRRPAGQSSSNKPLRRLDHAISQPELLYGQDKEALSTNDFYMTNRQFEDDTYDRRDLDTGEILPDDGGDYQPLNWRPDSGLDQYYDQRYGSKQSPFSPVNRHSSKRLGQKPAYYNSSSRFSLYHPTSDGIQSSLAPTSEQLRRILGYKPAPASSKPVHLHPQWAYSRPFIHLQPANLATRRRSSASPLGDDDEDEQLDGSDSELEGPRYWQYNRLQDTQAIRAVDFHPNGQVYAIGSNSRALRICAYPAEHELRRFNPLHQADHQADQQEATGGLETGKQQIKSPRVLFKFLQVHRGSIYCVAFNPGGQLLATGSNDQTVHLVRYNQVTHNPDGDEFRLTMHTGTVRDLCFIDDSFGTGSSLLLSAGGGDNKIYVTDCDTVTPYQSMAGHTQMVMGLNHCGGAQFVSGSYDKTIRFWDLRTRACTSIVSAPPAGGGGGAGAPVSSLRVDPSGRLLASGHTDSTCMLYDIRGGKIIQTFRPHDDEIRAISFSPKSYYLLTGSYDGRLVVSDLQGDLTRTLPSACVAQCHDKIVQAKWHPSDFTFVSTSADKSATLWSLPEASARKFS